MPKTLTDVSSVFISFLLSLNNRQKISFLTVISAKKAIRRRGQKKEREKRRDEDEATHKCHLLVIQTIWRKRTYAVH